MSSLPANLLLTGPPGCGKTTVVRHVIERLSHLRLAGFYTQEIRQQRQRMGFEAIGLSGVRATLSHVDFCTQRRLGRYGVDPGGFTTILRAELAKPAGQVDLYIIDEIGKMECLSPVFAEIVSRILGSPVPVLATIAAKGSGFIAEVAGRQDVEIVTVTAGNRDRLPDELVHRFRPR